LRADLAYECVTGADHLVEANPAELALQPRQVIWAERNQHTRSGHSLVVDDYDGA
jgi:hypothetical protein